MEGGRTMRITLLARVTVLCAGVALAQGSPTPRFQGLGDLPGDIFGSHALGVSADGKVAVGWSGSDQGQHAFRWTQETGMVGLLFNVNRSYAVAASADGSVVVGSMSADAPWMAFRWELGSDHNPMFLGPDYARPGYARGVSADGSVVVGYGVLAGQAQSEAYRWTAAEGVMPLGGAWSSEAHDCSADGSVVVGGSGDRPFRWTQEGGLQELGHLGGGARLGTAYAVSADGSVVAGADFSDHGLEAFRWTEIGGMVGLGDLSGGQFFSRAWDLSADGSVAVGLANSDLGEEAFIWDELHGMRRRRDVLEDECGLDLGAWTLAEARGVSADGNTIVGWGYNPVGDTEAWIATIPEPATLSLLAMGGALALLRRRSASS